MYGGVRVRAGRAVLPGTEQAISACPSAERTCEAFAAAGFSRVALHPVPRESAPTLAAFADGIRRDADSKSRGITDEEFAAGMADLRAGAEAGPRSRRPAGRTCWSCPDLLTHAAPPGSRPSRPPSGPTASPCGCGGRTHA